MENEKTVTRKYYKLSERNQANDDLAKAFPDIRTNVSGLQDKQIEKQSVGEISKRLSVMAKRKK